MYFFFKQQLQFLFCTEALRTGFFEFQALRDTYREITMGNVNKKLILKFIETQAIILSPICPHVSGKKFASIVKNLVINSSSILQNTCGPCWEKRNPF